MSSGGDVNSDSYRRAMSRFPTGVSVLTTTLGEVDHGMTANAISSVSLEPPIMLACIEIQARFYDAVLESGVWGCCLLPASARGASQWFATRGRPLHGQFDQYPTVRGEATGVALLAESLATFECRTRETIEAGDHAILVADVVSVGLPAHTDDALVWFRGGYGRLG